MHHTTYFHKLMTSLMYYFSLFNLQPLQIGCCAAPNHSRPSCVANKYQVQLACGYKASTRSAKWGWEEILKFTSTAWYNPYNPQIVTPCGKIRPPPGRSLPYFYADGFTSPEYAVALFLGYVLCRMRNGDLSREQSCLSKLVRLIGAHRQGI